MKTPKPLRGLIRGLLLIAALATVQLNSTVASWQSSVGQQQQLKPSLSTSTSSNESSPSTINLIPVDQPLISGKTEVAQPEAVAEDFNQALAEVEAPQAQEEQEGHQQLDEEASRVHKALEGSQPMVVEQQLAAKRPSVSQSEHNAVERRLGLFKKHHFGAPMATSASYVSQGAYLSDCERCLAGLGQQQHQSADLQQLEPLPVPVQPIQPPLQPMPLAPPQGMQPALSQLQPFGPLKSKLFMKFPFFMKPIHSFNGNSGAEFNPMHSSGPEVVPYWHQPTYSHHHHQSAPSSPRPQQVSPASSGALYLRPASAFNCIQAQPPLIVAASSTQQEVSSGSAGKTSGRESAPIKQYHPAHHTQQTTYSSSQY